MGLPEIAAHVRALAGRRRVAVAILLGAGAALALPPLHLLPLAVVGFSGLVWLIEGAAASARRPGLAVFLVGWWFGFGHFSVGLYWVANALLIEWQRVGWMIPFAVFGLAGVLGAFDENISWIEAEGFMYGGTYTGPNGVLENVFMKIATEWEGFTVTDENIVDGGDMVVALGKYSGKFLKTGRSVTVPFAHAWTLSGGKIVKFVQYTDTLVIARDLGL